jgi:hypothetical protein
MLLALTNETGIFSEDLFTPRVDAGCHFGSRFEGFQRVAAPFPVTCLDGAVENEPELVITSIFVDTCGSLRPASICGVERPV